jgi:signal transduction histidine kinase
VDEEREEGNWIVKYFICSKYSVVTADVMTNVMGNIVKNAVSLSCSSSHYTQYEKLSINLKISQSKVSEG